MSAISPLRQLINEVTGAIEEFNNFLNDLKACEEYDLSSHQQKIVLEEKYKRNIELHSLYSDHL